MLNHLQYLFIYIIILFSVILLSKKLGFFDEPNSRKIHKKKILNTSGIALYLFLILIASNFEYSFKLEEIIIYGFFIVLCGFIDDQYKLSPSVKLLIIYLPTAFLIFKDYNLTDLGSYEYLGYINLGKFGLIFTLLACGLLINSYNYIDGIDGLLIGLYIISLVYLIFIIANTNISKLLEFFIIGLSVNLFFNFLPYKNNFKIYMGDAGSLFLGFFMCFLLIYLYKFEKIHPSYLIWVCWYPVYDFLYVTTSRILNKKSFYQADNIHFHHYILKKFNHSHIKASFIIYLIYTIGLLLGFFITDHIGLIYSLITFIIAFLLFYLVRNKFEK